MRFHVLSYDMIPREHECMLLFALSAHSQPACCSFYVSLVFCHISEVCTYPKFKTPATCVVIFPLVSTAKRFLMYSHGKQYVKQVQGGSVHIIEPAPCVSPKEPTALCVKF